MKISKPYGTDAPLTLETVLYSLALILALLVRLVNLGAAPLSDYEASWALQAAQYVPGSSNGFAQALGPQPAYITLTGLAFTLFGSSNFLARFWPALAGALLVLAPALFRRWLGRGPAMLLAFGLALDPGLAATSRLVGGPMMAISFSMLAIGLWQTPSLGTGRLSSARPALAGLAGGLALLCGPAVIAGALSLGFTWLVLRIARVPIFVHNTFVHNAFGDPGPTSQPEPSAVPYTAAASPAAARRLALAALAATLVLVSTFFLLHPQGLAAWAGAITAYLNSWAGSGGASPADVSPGISPGIPAARMFTALLIYQPFALIAALVGVIGWVFGKEHPIRKESNWDQPYLPIVWGSISLLLALLNPGRQVSDLAWPLLPIWVLAAWAIGNMLPEITNSIYHPRPISLAHAGLLLLLTYLFGFTLLYGRQAALQNVNALPVQVFSTDVNVPWLLAELGMLTIVLVLATLTTTLIAIGWDWLTARDGLQWGALALFVVYTTNALWGATQLRSNRATELWSPLPTVLQADLFMNTLQDISRWQSGFANQIDIVSTVDAPSLRWALRNFSHVRFLAEPPVGEMPSIVITRQENSAPALATFYRGQDFAWWTWPGWEGPMPNDFVGWLAFREAPEQSTQIILWERANLVPSDGILPAQNTTPGQNLTPADPAQDVIDPQNKLNP